MWLTELMHHLTEFSGNRQSQKADPDRCLREPANLHPRRNLRTPEPDGSVLIPKWPGRYSGGNRWVLSHSLFPWGCISFFNWCCFYIYHLTGDKNGRMETSSLTWFSMNGNTMKSKLLEVLKIGQIFYY